MKTDLNSLKKELSKLTDVEYLKKEINRVANDVKNFDVQSRLSPEAKQKVAKLEKRFEELLSKLQQLQKQVDSNLDYLLNFVRSGKKATRRGQSSKAKKTVTTKKKAARTSAKKASTKKA